MTRKQTLEILAGILIAGTIWTTLPHQLIEYNSKRINIRFWRGQLFVVDDLWSAPQQICNKPNSLDIMYVLAKKIAWLITHQTS